MNSIHVRVADWQKDNADLRLTQKGYDLGLVTAERYEQFQQKKAAIEKGIDRNPLQGPENQKEYDEWLRQYRK